ncbi:MMPL family transporter [Pyruvatibacter sp.]
MAQILATLVTIITRFPVFTLLGLMLGTFAAGFYATTQFRVNTDQSSLIAPNSEFQQRFDRFRDAFPTYRRTTLVVVESASRSAAANGAADLAEALEAREDIFRSIFTTAAMPFFLQNGLLYLDTEDVASQLDALVQAQPGIAIVANEKGLAGTLSLLRQGLTQLDDTGQLNPSLMALANDLTRAARTVADDAAPPLRFNLGSLGSNDAQTAIELISIQIREDTGDFLSPRAKLDVIRATAVNLGLTPENGLTVRLTGNIPLSVDELSQVRESLGLAGALSLVMLAVVLGLGVRSGRIVSVMVMTLAVGGVWSMAWAMFSVGEVNLLSASFAVLFVGLGIDFAIHYALRAQEDVEKGIATGPALITSAQDVGPAIALGAVTSAIGFLSFLPTDYKGFADLGVIAGGGMALAFIAALTVIPASLGKFGIPAHRNAGGSFAALTSRAFAISQIHARGIAMAAVVCGIASAAIATNARFDFSTLALKNSQSEPILALADLQERGMATDYAAYVIAPSLEASSDTVTALKTLPTMGSVRTANSLIPTDQGEKLALIEDTAFLFFPLFSKINGPAAAVPDSLSFPMNDDSHHDTRATLDGLTTALSALTPTQLEGLNTALADQLTRDLSRLTDIFEAEPVTSLDQIPAPVKGRYLSADGQALVIGLPKGDVTRTEDLRAFVADVKSLFPDSTGRAVVEATVGDIVVNAFVTALVIALCAVTLIVLMATGSFRDTALILMPLLLAAVATAATGVLIDMPFNQANIIVLPLIMGLGVDNGIHVLMRYRKDSSLESLLKSSTPRAIVLSTLTTIGAFGALSVSVHAGTASMGILLTIAMLYLLIATVFVLPALLSLAGKRR